MHKSALTGYRCASYGYESAGILDSSIELLVGCIGKENKCIGIALECPATERICGDFWRETTEWYDKSGISRCKSAGTWYRCVGIRQG